MTWKLLRKKKILRINKKKRGKHSNMIEREMESYDFQKWWLASNSPLIIIIIIIIIIMMMMLMTMTMTMMMIIIIITLNYYFIIIIIIIT